MRGGHGQVAAIGHALGASLLVLLALGFAIAEDFVKEPFWWLSRMAACVAFVTLPSFLVWVARKK